jgi:hypothetical protein
MDLGGQRHALLIYPQERDPVLILQEVGWAPGPVWTGAEISQSKGFDPWTIQSIASRCIYDTFLVHGWILCAFQNGTHISSLHNCKLV